MLADASYAIENGAAFVSTNADIKYPTEFGFAPGNGAISEMLHAVTGVAPVYIGKPAPHMLDIIRQQFRFAKRRNVDDWG